MTSNIGANPNPRAAGFSFNGKDALIGGLAGSIFGSPILGALVGSVARSLFAPAAQDMNAAYDPNRATKGGSTFDFGDLKGMFDGLMGNLRTILDGAAQQAQARGEYSNQPPPENAADATRAGRPAQGPDVERQAQTQATGTNWGKILKWGAIGLAGLTLMNSPILHYMATPGYGAGLGFPFGRMFW